MSEKNKPPPPNAPLPPLPERKEERAISTSGEGEKLAPQQVKIRSTEPIMIFDGLDPKE
jgi:hypothetical protein